MSGLDIRAVVLGYYRTRRRYGSPVGAAIDAKLAAAEWVAEAVAEGRDPEWRLEAYRFARALASAAMVRTGPPYPAELTPHQSYWATGRMESLSLRREVTP